MSEWKYRSHSRGEINVCDMHPKHLKNALRKKLREHGEKGVSLEDTSDIVALSVGADMRGVKINEDELKSQGS